MKYFIALLFTTLPATIYAQGTNKNFSQLVYGLGGFFQGILNIIIALSFVVFFWGLMKRLGSTSETAIKEAKAIMVWGVIGLTVSLSIIGILALGVQTAEFVV